MHRRWDAGVGRSCRKMKEVRVNGKAWVRDGSGWSYIAIFRPMYWFILSK